MASGVGDRRETDKETLKGEIKGSILLLKSKKYAVVQTRVGIKNKRDSAVLLVRDGSGPAVERDEDWLSANVAMVWLGVLVEGGAAGLHSKLTYKGMPAIARAVMMKSGRPGQAPSGTRWSDSTSTCKTHRQKGVRGQEAAGRAGRAGRAAGEGGRPLVAAGGRPRTLTGPGPTAGPTQSHRLFACSRFYCIGAPGGLVLHR